VMDHVELDALQTFIEELGSAVKKTE
jgi:hypothetical protein